MHPIVVSFISALVAFVLGLFAQTWLALRNMDIAALNELYSRISQIEELALEYWLTEGQNDDLKEKIASAKLLGALQGSEFFDSFAERVFSRRTGDYMRLDGDLYDAATGGSFQVKGRHADPERALAVTKAANALRALIRDQRRRLYWAH